MRWLSLALAALFVAEPAFAAPPIIAHRGRDASVPENTLAAFRHSKARGITILETDVRVTKDGEFVLLHDPTVDRTTNGRGQVGDLTLAEVQRLDAGSGEHVPTLRDALRLVRGSATSLLLDMKPGTPLKAVLDLVATERAAANVVFGHRSPREAARLRLLAPEVRAVALMKSLNDLDAFEQAGIRNIRLWSHWIDPAAGGDPALVARVKARGDQVWCIVGRRVPKRDAEWKALHARLMTLGIDAIATDRPDLLRPTS
jgi:glycerophosphoryl diester phosphodiesterase